MAKYAALTRSYNRPTRKMPPTVRGECPICDQLRLNQRQPHPKGIQAVPEEEKTEKLKTAPKKAGKTQNV